MRALTATFPAQTCRHMGCRGVIERPPLAAGGSSAHPTYTPACGIGRSGKQWSSPGDGFLTIGRFRWAAWRS